MFKNLYRRFSNAKPEQPTAITEQQIEAVWEGTPFLEHLPFIRVQVEGKDKRYIKGLADEYFDMARVARQRQEHDALILALCLSIGCNLFAAEYLDAATALGNLAMVYEQKQQYQVALRLQSYAFDLKRRNGASREMMARSLWLIGRANAALGKYEDAKGFLSDSCAMLPNPKVAAQLQWVIDRLRTGEKEGRLPPG
jgi:tetratricopeptide (TPR) repeat protein